MKRVGTLRSQWVKEIPALVKEVPDFDATVSVLREYFV